MVSVDGLPAVGPDGVPLSESALRLRKDLIVHLRRQGFEFRNGGLEAPPVEDKEHLRALHRESVRSQLDRARPALERHERSFLERLADGDEVDPSRIRPRLIELHSPRDHNDLLWRWSTLHWSIPVSAGYGRRVRFLVVDEGHGTDRGGRFGLRCAFGLDYVQCYPWLFVRGGVCHLVRSPTMEAVVRDARCFPAVDGMKCCACP
jgi:hypothetical protein